MYTLVPNFSRGPSWELGFAFSNPSARAAMWALRKSGVTFRTAHVTTTARSSAGSNPNCQRGRCRSATRTSGGRERQRGIRRRRRRLLSWRQRVTMPQAVTSPHSEPCGARCGSLGLAFHLPNRQSRRRTLFLEQLKPPILRKHQAYFEPCSATSARLR